MKPLPKFTPVIHVTSDQQASEETSAALANGADGVFLIDHKRRSSKLLESYERVRKENPEAWIGINFLDLKPTDAIAAMPSDADALWLDSDFGLTPESLPKNRNWVAFIGTAFKYQPQPDDLAAESIRVASEYGEGVIVTTSGAGTGQAAEISKLDTMKAALESNPLAIASGVTLENLDAHLSHVDIFLVATGISLNPDRLDPEKTKEMARRIHNHSAAQNASADSIYLMGSTHHVCEDYAAVRINDGDGMIVALSDGCSSSPKTDVGARILVETILAFRPGYLIDRFGKTSSEEDRELAMNTFRQKIQAARNAIQLPEHAFDATLIAVAQLADRLLVIFWGDGHLLIRHTNGEVTTLDVDYEKNQNAPYYPSYELFGTKREAGYEAEFGIPHPNRVWLSKTLAAPRELTTRYPTFEIPLDTIQSISIFSDGASTFLKGQDPMPVEEITLQCSDFKSTEGQLVTRRINKCRKLWRKEDIQHADDFSMATIHFQ